jgi:hypothetical protein
MNGKKTLKKTRFHYILFCKDTPFKQKIVKSKVAYTRKEKYPVKEKEYA